MATYLYMDLVLTTTGTMSKVGGAKFLENSSLTQTTMLSSEIG